MDDNRIILDWKTLPDYIRDVPEYTFLDKADVLPGKEASGVKLASGQDWYFHIHFPGNPIMPGVLLMECIQQTGGLIINTMPNKKSALLMFLGCSNVRMYDSVRPGDTVYTKSVLNSYKRGVARFSGEAKKGNTLICEMDFTLIVEGEFVTKDKLSIPR